jgi:DNA polymerase-3 subunit delta
MEQKKLKTELAKGELRNLYLLYGEEKFLVQHYAREIEKFIADKKIFEGAVPVAEIIMAAETVSFFDASEKKLILIRDSKLFATGRKDDSEKMAEYFSKIPAETVLIFSETEIDKRTRIFKKISELGAAVECSPLSSYDLEKWITRLAKDKNKIFEPAAVNFFLRTCGNNMQNLANEAEKLFHFCANKNEISANDISQICTPTLESRIFDLTKAMGAGKISDALKLYQNMIFLKESPHMILSMIIRQLRIILLCKCHAEKNTPRTQIARELKIMDFVITEALSHGRRFTTEKLISALTECQNTDAKIKTGLLAPEIGVEMLLISLA